MLVRRALAVVLASMCVTFAGCGQPAAPARDDSAARMTSLADAYVHDYFEAFPYQAVYSGAPDVHPDQLVDHSLAALARWHAREEVLLKELKAIDVAKIAGTPQEIIYKFLQNQIESAIAFRACRTEVWNVSPTAGWQGDLAVVAGQQATDTPEQQRNAVARFSQLPKYETAYRCSSGYRQSKSAQGHGVKEAHSS